MIQTKNIPQIDPDEFWRGVRIGKENECWEWQLGRTGKNYGYVCLKKAQSERSRRMVLSHRIAWTLTNGIIPDNMWVLHRCDNPPCCNPCHLFLGTHADNVADCIAKGRNAKGARSVMRLYPELVMHGVKHPLAKLDDFKVREIRTERKSGATLKSLADKYGVCLAKVHQIIERKSWAHVT